MPKTPANFNLSKIYSTNYKMELTQFYPRKDIFIRVLLARIGNANIEENKYRLNEEQ